MQVVKCANVEEAKKNVKKALEMPETTIIKIGNKEVAAISNCPNEIYDIFRLPILPLENKEEELDLSKRIEKVANSYSLQLDENNTDYILKVKHGIASVLVDKIIVKKLKKFYQNQKEEIIDDMKIWNNWIKFIQYVNPYLDRKNRKDPDLIFARCEAEIFVDDVKFEATFSVPLEEEDSFLVYSKTKLKEHCYFKDYMTALQLCKYLIHYNITDVYDGFTTKIPTKKVIYEYNRPFVEMTAYECDKGIYVKIVRGAINRDITQLVFIDNSYVRKNIEKARFIDVNFIGLHKNYEFNKKFYDYIKQNKKIEKEAKEKILSSFTAQDLRMIVYLEPEIKDDLIVFSIGNYEKKFSLKHLEWINEMKAIFKFTLDKSDKQKNIVSDKNLFL